MKVGVLIFLTCLSGALVGCSSKPDVGDVEAGLKESWGMCEGLKLVDLKKTNGVDNGNTYDLAVSYKLEITKDATAEAAWGTHIICPSPAMLPTLWAVGKADNKFGTALKKGDLINVEAAFRMVKSEKGWITQ